MSSPNPHAVALGRLARGIPKRITAADRERRRRDLARARAIRLARLRAARQAAAARQP